jgi:hypothetical protein
LTLTELFVLNLTSKILPSAAHAIEIIYLDEAIFSVKIQKISLVGEAENIRQLRGMGP